MSSQPFKFFYLVPIVWVIKSRKMGWAGHVVRTGEARGAYRILVEKPEGERPLGTPRRKWEDNIRVEAIVNAIMNLRVQ
jgi:hypothetical protein